MLDASGVTMDGCDGPIAYEWMSSDESVVGTDPQLIVSPEEDEEYTVEVTCTSNPGCSLSIAVRVEVHVAPTFSGLRAQDLSTCSLGLQLTWDPAVFPDAGGGVYHVYRSSGPAASCDDALTRPPLVTLGVLEWIDRETAPGETYTYVVEAEAEERPTACLPVGPLGGAVHRLCTEGITDEGQFPFPEGVFAVLRVGHRRGETTVHWRDVRPLLPGEHFHLLKAIAAPTNVFIHVNGEGETATSWVDPDGSEELGFFDLRVANGCEEQSLDEFPPSY